MRYSNYTDKQYWDSYWEKETRKEIDCYFSDLLDEYINWDTTTSYMEIGGAPGSIIAFMYKVHNMKVSTIDFTEKNRMIEYLKQQGITDYDIYQEDFLTYDIRSHKRKYDIVASWGFVEHFDKKVSAELIAKKKEMVAEQGYLLIELPNIRRIMWLIYFIFNRKMIKIHNLKTMDLEWLKKTVQKNGEFEILYSSYYFAMNSQNDFFIKHRILDSLCSAIVDYFKKCKFKNNVKKWFFPYIVVIAKRKKIFEFD